MLSFPFFLMSFFISLSPAFFFCFFLPWCKVPRQTRYPIKLDGVPRWKVLSSLLFSFSPPLDRSDPDRRPDWLVDDWLHATIVENLFLFLFFLPDQQTGRIPADLSSDQTLTSTRSPSNDLSRCGEVGSDWINFYIPGGRRKKMLDLSIASCHPFRAAGPACLCPGFCALVGRWPVGRSRSRFQLGQNIKLLNQLKRSTYTCAYAKHDP